MVVPMSFVYSLTKYSTGLLYSLQKSSVYAHHFICSHTGGWKVGVNFFFWYIVYIFSSYKSVRFLREHSVSYKTYVPYPIISIS